MCKNKSYYVNEIDQILSDLVNLNALKFAWSSHPHLFRVILIDNDNNRRDFAINDVSFALKDHGVGEWQHEFQRLEANSILSESRVLFEKIDWRICHKSAVASIFVYLKTGSPNYQTWMLKFDANDIPSNFQKVLESWDTN